MGRPINKKFLGKDIGLFKVAQYRRAGNYEEPGAKQTFVVSQKSNNKFLIEGDGWSDVLRLVDKAPGTLDEGEFRIDATDPDGAQTQITRLYNRVVRLGNNTKAAWDVNQKDNFVISRIYTDIQVLVEIADTSDLKTGQFIGIIDLPELTELNNGVFTITVIDGTTFSLNHTVNESFDLYDTQGRVVTNIG